MVRCLVTEHRGEPVDVPVHFDCREALARECAGLVSGLLVDLMRRRSTLYGRIDTRHAVKIISRQVFGNDPIGRDVRRGLVAS